VEFLAKLRKMVLWLEKETTAFRYYLANGLFILVFILLTGNGIPIKAEPITLMEITWR